jgi:hypothetical protein
MRSNLKKINELDYLIREQRTGSPANLGQKIGASERSVFDYLKLMKEMGAPISYSRTRSSYIYQHEGRFNIRFKEHSLPSCIMMKGLAIGIMACSWLHIAAQQKAAMYVQLSGKVTDTIGLALSRATVQLIQGTDTSTTFSHDDGNFNFSYARPGRIILLITMKGYLPYRKLFTVPEGNSAFSLMEIPLRNDYDELDPATVTRVRPINIQDDTVSYNVAAFPVQDGSEVEDILRRLPGIEVDVNGNITIQGKPLTKVLVNGKEFFGSDVLLAIRNLPADIVKKIQVIDDYGDMARLTGVQSGDAAKVLNIVLKPDKSNGEFGRGETGYGTQGKYLGNAFANAFKSERQVSAQTGIRNNSPTGNDREENGAASYANQWNPSWSGSVALNINSGFPHSGNSISQETFYPGETLQNTQNNRTTAHSANTTMETRLTFKPGSYSTLRLTASSDLQQSSSLSTGDFTTLQRGNGYTKASMGQTLSISHTTGQILNSNLYFEIKSPSSRRRFSMEGGMGFSSINGFNNSQSSGNVLVDSISTASATGYLTFNNTRTWGIYLNNNLFLPIGQKAFVDLGYRVRSTLSKKNTITQQPDSGNLLPLIIDSLSQQTALHGLTQDFYTAYTARLGRLNLTSGLDAQPGTQKGTVQSKGDVTSYEYFSILPYLQAAWSFDKSRRLSLNYSSWPSLPSLQQIAPFTNVSNPQYPVTGNPDLRPSYTNSLGLHYDQSSFQRTQFVGFGMGVTYSSTRNTIIQDLSSPKNNSLVLQATTYLNAGPTNNLIIDCHFTPPALFEKRLRIYVNGSISKAHTISLTDSLEYLSQTWVWNQSIIFQLLIPDLIETDLSGNYSITRTLYSASSSLPSSFQSAGFTSNNRLYFTSKWILNYQLSQAYISSGARLQPASTTLTASLQHQFLPHNSASIILSGFNLLNQSAAAGQSATPTTITYNMPTLTGRYILLTFQLKPQHFRN